MSHKWKRAGFTLLVGAAACMISPAAQAQPPERRPLNTFSGAGNAKDAREMVEMVMMVRLSRELELTEEETVLLVRRMTEFREELGKLNRKRRSLSANLRELTNGENAESDDEAIQLALKDLKKSDQRINNAKLEMHEKLSEGLDANQQGRLYFFLEDFEENMRHMVQRVRDRRRAMEGGRMGRGDTPPQRVLRDRLPRGPQSGSGRDPASELPSREGDDGSANARPETVRDKSSSQQ
jgi:hypothetical protein